MAQMKLIPADNMKDKLWGKKGTPEREAMETRLPYARLDWHKTSHKNSLVSVSVCSVLRYQSWRKVQVLSHYQP